LIQWSHAASMAASFIDKLIIKLTRRLGGGSAMVVKGLLPQVRALSHMPALNKYKVVCGTPL